MSQRFPSLASQFELDHGRRYARGGTPTLALSLALVPSLPWFEMLLGAAFLMAMQCL